MLIASNKSLAEFNLAREPAYRETRDMLLDSHKEALDIKREVEHKRHKLDDVTRQTSLDTTLALLQTAAAEAEEESERCAESFLSGDLPLEQFLSNFLDKRKIAHMRRIKTEKLIEHVRSQGRGSAAADNGPIRPAPAPPGGAPYPVGGPTMPTPGGGFNYPFSRPFN